MHRGRSLFEAEPEMLSKLDQCVRLSEPQAITRRVEATLSEMIVAGRIELPREFRETPPHRYTRRLLHRNEELDYTVMVMTWPPGFCSPLHDHAGMWCVVGVIHGEMLATRFELQEIAAGLYRFGPTDGTRATVGRSGSLVPPDEYHTLGNGLENRISISLHVYSGKMDRCGIYEPRSDGWYERKGIELSFDE